MPQVSDSCPRRQAVACVILPTFSVPKSPFSFLIIGGFLISCAKSKSRPPSLPQALGTSGSSDSLLEETPYHFSFLIILYLTDFCFCLHNFLFLLFERSLVRILIPKDGQEIAHRCSFLRESERRSAEPKGSAEMPRFPESLRAQISFPALSKFPWKCLS